MIRVWIWRDQAGAIRRFRAEGHAGYAEHGQDIVCAAVAALTQTAVLGLQEVAGLEVEVAIDGERGLLDCRILGPKGKIATGPRGGAETSADEKQAAVLETMLLGLHEIAKQYRGYVEVEERKLCGGKL